MPEPASAPKSSRFYDMLTASWRDNASLACVGLDPELSRLPDGLARNKTSFFEFLRDIVDATHDLVCAYKPQIAHFASEAAEPELERVIDYIKSTYPTMPVILDAKRGDIGSTAEHYAREAFERYGADACTVNPYLGRDSVQPFLDYADKGVVLLCRTSNPGAVDLQEIEVDGRALYEVVADKVASEWNDNGNCALVVGATWPEEIGRVRRIVGELPLLIPGLGAQGGDVEQVVRHGATAAGGLIMSSSRGVLYADSSTRFADAARDAARALRDDINRQRAGQNV